MRVTRGRILSLLVAVGYVLYGFIAIRPFDPSAIAAFFLLAFPLALIWFPDELGSLTGYMGRGASLNFETPGSVVAFAGWMFLLAPAVILLIRWVSRNH